MRRLFVPLGALLALVLVGPMSAFAQDATPPSGTTVSGFERTDLRYFLPYGPDGLNADLMVSGNESGVCANESLVDPGRPDAWDCLGSSDNTVYDPCFAAPVEAPDEVTELACAASPFTDEVVRFELTEPLPRQKEAASAGPGDGDVDGWEMPWALLLANGERCTLLTEETVVLAGERLHYGCEGGGSVLGEVDSGQETWTVSYLENGAVSTTLVDVAVAWV